MPSEEKMSYGELKAIRHVQQRQLEQNLMVPPAKINANLSKKLREKNVAMIALFIAVNFLLGAVGLLIYMLWF